jgi:hypothetical protein
MCYFLLQIVIITLSFVVDNVWMQFEFIKIRQLFNRGHKTIVRLVRKFKKTGSAYDFPQRPKHRATIRQRDRYMQINSPS